MEYGHRTNVKCSNKQRARPFMTEILLICCICIKAPKSVCRVSVNHTIISFLLSSAHSLPSVVALLLLVFTRFFCVCIHSPCFVTHSFIFMLGLCLSLAHVSVCMAQRRQQQQQNRRANDDCCGVRMQTCVRKQCDDQLTLTINTPIFRSHDDTYVRVRFVSSVARCVCLCICCVFFMYAWLTMKR